MPEKLKCQDCHRMKRVGLFYKTNGTKRGYSIRCKACHKKTPSYMKALDAYYIKTYGLTLEEYTEILDLQNGRCFVCQRKPGKRRLAVDHDHATEEKGMRKSVRGLLCHDCNEFLGKIKDDPTAGDRIREYLTRPHWTQRKN